MSTNIKIRTLINLVSVLLGIVMLSGAAPINPMASFAQAQFSDDVFEPTSATFAPTANFSADPTSGQPPLQVQFTDESTGSPTGWAWYFGDEAFNAPWLQMSTGAGWTSRTNFPSVALPDGSIVLMGGFVGSDSQNDVWRSTDQGTNWTQITATASWNARLGHTSVALPDGSIILMGGYGDSDRLNDAWRSTDQGANWTQMTAAAEWSKRDSPISVALPDGSIVLMGGYDGSYQNDVWRSTNQGATWTQMTAAAEWSKRDSHTSVALPDGSIVLMGGFDGARCNDVWRSTDQGATWTQMTAAAEWSKRNSHTSVALPDGSIVLMGGYDGSYRNDVWRSTNQGATWTQMTADAEWTARRTHTSVALPDGSIVLMGGFDGARVNDVWRLETAGSSEQHPTHIYTALGTYSVALQAYNADGFSSLRRLAYINVNTGDYLLCLPLILRDFPITPDAPVLNAIDNADGDGSYTVSWSTSEGADTYTLQEATNTNFTDAVTVYSGPNASKNIAGNDMGTYYYRVSAANAYASSSWSNVQPVQVTEPLPDCPQTGQWSGKTSQGLNITFEVQNSPVCQVAKIVLQVKEPYNPILVIIPWGSQPHPITNTIFNTGLDTIGVYKARVTGFFPSISTSNGTFYVEYYDYGKIPPLQWWVSGTWTASP